MDQQTDNQTGAVQVECLPLMPRVISIHAPALRSICLRSKKAWIIGNVRDGIDKNKLHHSIHSTVARNLLKNASTVKWLADVHGVKARTTTLPIRQQSINVVLPSARWTKHALTTITTGNASIAN